MDHASEQRNRATFILVGILLLAILNLGEVHANNLGNLIRESGIHIGGWINGGATYNANNPSDGFNGPVTFADRANRFQLNQFNLFIQGDNLLNVKNFFKIKYKIWKSKYRA